MQFHKQSSVLKKSYVRNDIDTQGTDVHHNPTKLVTDTTALGPKYLVTGDYSSPAADQLFPRVTNDKRGLQDQKKIRNFSNPCPDI
ncbi:hypothetical protein JTB14_011366 [Gonioctena quinquepunctata]|nr:hypothetical protein JTB14_011366 [Gonioctena quinquepunctata]